MPKLKAILLTVLFLCSSAFANPLDDYINKSDLKYSCSIEKKVIEKDYTFVTIRLISQAWRIQGEVSPSIWQHWLTLTIPKEMRSNKALLIVGNGLNTEGVPENPEHRWAELAIKSNSVVAEIRNVPNQPMMYLNDHEERFEDNSVAYSWDKAMTTHDPTWSIRFPMVKSVVKAMDCVQEAIPILSDKKQKIDQFVVAGESKRGWVTWLSAAVDQRVIAIIPMVIDVLKVQKFIKQHFSVYGFWAPALKDYVKHGILTRAETKDFEDLMALEDPFSYRNRINVPKYIINATGDQFFLPDWSAHYFNDLKGLSYLRNLPNTDHSMRNSDVFECLGGFYSEIIAGSSLPRFSWKRKSDGSIEVMVVDKPRAVKVWMATNPKSRDFRLQSIGNEFHSEDLKENAAGLYVGKVKPPKTGFTAFFVELTYSPKKDKTLPLKFTTEVSVIPDRLPFKSSY